uniref:Uncharacterized protein n=1 Tax=Moniliophthora roreri TaxID=221103 RepID=A0A0W0G178_MONRR
MERGVRNNATKSSGGLGMGVEVILAHVSEV